MRFGIAVLVFGLCSVAAPRLFGAEDDALAAFFQDYLDRVFRAEPLTATRLGEHRYDDRLDDLSAEARAANVARDRQALADLPRKVDYDKLARNGQIDFEILRHHLTRNVWLAETFHPFEDDPRVYGDYLTESVYLLLTQSSLPKETNLKNALARMEHVPGVVKVAKRTIARAQKVKVETAIRQTQGAIGFYTGDLFTISGEPKETSPLAKRAGPIVAALKDYLEFLKTEVLPNAGDDWRIGPELFARKLELELDAGLSAAEVLNEAELEAVRVEREMAVVARQLWGTTFPGAPIPPDDAEGRRTMTSKVLDAVGRNHGTPETLVADARKTVRDIKAFIAEQKILRLPEPDQCRVIEMPEFMRGNSVAYLNPAPPLDPRGSSEYAISPPPADWSPERVASFLKEYNAAMLKILTIHEAYPGHYVQLEYSNRTPSMVRKVLSSGTFAEGWAVYTEQMMLDQGYGQGDLALRLNQLKFYLRAVVNAILDHKMHAGAMTDAEARELLMGRAFQTEGEAVGKIVRSKQSSCQLSTYFVGRTAFTGSASKSSASAATASSSAPTTRPRSPTARSPSSTSPNWFGPRSTGRRNESDFPTARRDRSRGPAGRVSDRLARLREGGEGPARSDCLRRFFGGPGLRLRSRSGERGGRRGPAPHRRGGTARPERPLRGETGAGAPPDGPAVGIGPGRRPADEHGPVQASRQQGVCRRGQGTVPAVPGRASGCLLEGGPRRHARDRGVPVVRPLRRGRRLRGVLGPRRPLRGGLPLRPDRAPGWQGGS